MISAAVHLLTWRQFIVLQQRQVRDATRRLQCHKQRPYWRRILLRYCNSVCRHPKKLAPGETGFVFIGNLGRGSTWRRSYCCKVYCSATILLVQLLAVPVNKENEYRLSTELTGHSGDVRAVVNLQTDEGQSVYVVTSTS